MTVDIDSSVLRQLRDYQRGSGKSLGALASELLAEALADLTSEHPPCSFQWLWRPMGAQVDLEDRDAVTTRADAGINARDPCAG